VRQETCAPVPSRAASAAELRRIAALRLGGALALSALKALIYFLSFLGPALVISWLIPVPVPVLVLLAMVGYAVSGCVFLGLVVGLRRLIAGELNLSGRRTIDHPEVKRWFVAAILNSLMIDGLFRSMVTGLSFLSAAYYRGMGARMPNSVFMGLRVMIYDPWHLEVGENVNIGAGTVISGHAGNGKVVTFDRVVIEDEAILGANILILPGVRIGRQARVAAGAVVITGTAIPDGETWAGVPAKKINDRSS